MNDEEIKEEFNGILISIHVIGESNLSFATKHEIIEWMWASNMVSNEHYKDFHRLYKVTP